MTLFSDDFEGTILSDDWDFRPVSLEHGVLSFAPPRHGFQLVTKRQDFGDFVMSADVRVVEHAAGFILRWSSRNEYYMVQIGRDGEQEEAWFHSYSKRFSASGGYELEIVSGAPKPLADQWYRMQVTAKGAKLTLALGKVGEPLQECGSWTDPHQLHSAGAIGFCQSPGEHGEFRNLQVTALD